MRIEEFDYALLPSLIAQYPSPQRGDTRLMVLHRSQGTIQHKQFSNILAYLHPGDLLVLNNTRVLPARLIGKKETGGRCELLLLPSWNGRQGNWEVLVRGSAKIKGRTRIQFNDEIEGELEVGKDGKGEIASQVRPKSRMSWTRLAISRFLLTSNEKMSFWTRIVIRRFLQSETDRLLLPQRVFILPGPCFNP